MSIEAGLWTLGIIIVGAVVRSVVYDMMRRFRRRS